MSSTQKTKAELRIQDRGWPRRDRSPEENGGWEVQQECFHPNGSHSNDRRKLSVAAVEHGGSGAAGGSYLKRNYA